MNEATKDWRAIGARINEEFIQFAKKEWAPFTYQVVRRQLINDEDILVRAIVLAAQGDLKGLIRFLESDRQIHLSKDTRDWLARVLKRRPWVRKRGRQKDNVVRIVADVAMQFYKKWKSANEEAGISNWGLGESMKHEACCYAVELWNSRDHHHHKVEIETVRQMMDRPKSRQK